MIVLVRKNNLALTALALVLTVMTAGMVRNADLAPVSAVPAANKVIVVDAGHGAPDGGAVGGAGTVEADINLAIAKRLQELLQKSGAQVVMTRSDGNAIADDMVAKIRDIKRLLRKAENNEVPEVYQLPDSIDVTGVSFELESGILTCEFVPAVYSDKLNYNVTALTSGYKGRKTDAAILENGVGEVKLPVKDAMFYKVVLEITNGVESRNVTLADKLYVDNKNNIVTEH